MYLYHIGDMHLGMLEFMRELLDLLKQSVVGWLAEEEAGSFCNLSATL